MKQHLIIESVLKQLISESPAQETENDNDSLFTPAEEKFLGKFDAYGTKHLGIIYSISDVGIREFIGRSGKDLNVTPEILKSLIDQGIIKIVPYTGHGRDDDYTLELQLNLDAVKGLGAEDKANAEKSAETAPEIETPELEPETTPEPEVAWVVKYGDILRESVKITKSLITEASSKTKTSAKTTDYLDKTRVLQRLPKDYVRHMDRVIKMMDKKTKTAHEKERMIADVLDILQVTMKLTPTEIRKSYEFHKNQKRLRKHLDKK